MYVIVQAAAILGLALILIGVHEFGHYLAGIWCGIPASDLSVRLFTFPQHVAIRDGDEWVSPVTEIERYIDLTSRHFASEAAAFGYVAGGIVGEGIFMLTATLLAVLCEFRFLAFWLPLLSLWMYLVNLLLMDLPWAILFGQPRGDTSGLWSIARVPAVAFTVVMLALRVLLCWWIVTRSE